MDGSYFWWVQVCGGVFVFWRVGGFLFGKQSLTMWQPNEVFLMFCEKKSEKNEVWPFSNGPILV